ncbi:MAG: ROK family protein [Trueperaceae bacterium]
MKTLGLDLGGTKIAAAVVEHGKILERKQTKTPQTGLDSVVDALVKLSEDLLEHHPDIPALGLGVPGPLDFKNGRIRFAPNIMGLEDAPIVSLLEKRLDIRVVLENDANAAGFAEHKYGAATEFDSSLYVTISTGIGGGLFVNDMVIRGANGITGEIGHMTVMPHGPLCGCGQGGCWEAVASGRSIAREASFSYGETLTTQQVFERARAGERKALSVIENAAYFTGVGLSNLQKIFDPHVFVIGGGMSQVGDFYLDKIKAYTAEFNEGFPPSSLRLAELGTDAGVIGAAAVAAI